MNVCFKKVTSCNPEYKLDAYIQGKAIGTRIKMAISFFRILVYSARAKPLTRIFAKCRLPLIITSLHLGLQELLITANFDAQGKIEIITENLKLDKKGLKMQMVILKA